MKRITVISDTHNKHKQLNSFLPGGHLILHGGDLTSLGYKHEIQSFCAWYNKLGQYDNKIFIAGNHDFGFEERYEETINLVNGYSNIKYLQDELYDIDGIKIYGAPWQPEFYNWAFNLPRNGIELTEKWGMIPENIDILITHGPPFGYLDVIKGDTLHIGCELLTERLKIVKPKIHIFGHIHTGYGYYFNGETHFINAAVLNERYNFEQKPYHFEWDEITNEINFL